MIINLNPVDTYGAYRLDLAKALVEYGLIEAIIYDNCIYSIKYSNHQLYIDIPDTTKNKDKLKAIAQNKLSSTLTEVIRFLELYRFAKHYVQT